MKHHLPVFGALALMLNAAQAEELRQPIDIPAQALSSALDNLAKQTRLQLLFDRQALAGKQSSGLSGDYTGVEAARKLLAGSGLIVEQTGDNAVSIRPASANEPQSATTLPAVKVVGQAQYDATDPYNQDYVLPNATAGTKTDTPIMETPLNVQVISKQVMKDQQVVTLADSLKNVSGVTIASTSTFGSQGGTSQGIFLRGFQSQTFFRDGFRLQQGTASRAMANVESVEVLKGPAAILYGLVEPGGMVNVVTKQPLATPYYALNQQFGSYDFYRTTVDATGPLTDNKDLLYRMNLSYQNSGSFRDFVGKEDVFLAPVLKWNISPRTQAGLELEYNHQHLGLDQTFVPFANGKLMNIPRSRNYAEYSPATTDTVYGGFNWSHQFNDDWSIKQRFSVNQYRTDWDKQTLPYYAFGPDVYRYQFGMHNSWNTYATSLDLTGHFDTVGLRHTLLIGGDYYRLDALEDDQRNSELSAINILDPVHPGTPFTQPMRPYFQGKDRTDQYGLYIQDQIQLPYQVHVMGGIRYQNIHQNSMTQYTPAFGGGSTDTAQSQDAVTPRVGLLWQPQGWLSLYANYVESFGANTGQMFPGKPVPPSSAEQYEGGIKTEFFDGRLRTNLAYYDLTKTNIVTNDLLHQGFVLATGAARSRGTELDITGEILPGWNVIATYTYTDARVTKSNNLGVTDVPVGGRLRNVPRNTGSFWNTYELQEGDLKGLKFGAGVTVRNGIPGSFDAPGTNLPGYATVDLLAAYSLHVGKSKVTAQLNVNNLLDKHYYSGVFGINNYLGSGLNIGQVDFGAPRSLMGSIGVQF